MAASSFSICSFSPSNSASNLRHSGVAFVPILPISLYSYYFFRSKHTSSFCFTISWTFISSSMWILCSASIDFSLQIPAYISAFKILYSVSCGKILSFRLQVSHVKLKIAYSGFEEALISAKGELFSNFLRDLDVTSKLCFKRISSRKDFMLKNFQFFAVLPHFYEKDRAGTYCQ